MKVLVTGSSGYIGTTLLKRLVKESSVSKIMGIDLLPKPAEISSDKLICLEHDLAVSGWQNKVLSETPIDAVVHLAFKIRSPYGKVGQTKKQNLLACKNVFEFAFQNKIPKLIYSSSVAAYGAKKENIGIFLKESDPLQENKSSYGIQKKMVEELLQKITKESKPITNTIVVRLNSVTGPAGQNLKSKFGLITFLKKILPFVIEADPAWARQFIHEKDVEEIIWRLLNARLEPGKLEIYNAAPPSCLTAREIAGLLKKRVLKVPAFLIKPAFWLAWHISLGRIPTRPNSANSLIYPINVDGSKIEDTGFHYQFTAADALLARE